MASKNVGSFSALWVSAKNKEMSRQFLHLNFSLHNFLTFNVLLCQFPTFFRFLHTICRFRTRFTWCNLDKKDSIGYLWQHFDFFSEPVESLKIMEGGAVRDHHYVRKMGGWVQEILIFVDILNRWVGQKKSKNVADVIYG